MRSPIRTAIVFGCTAAGFWYWAGARDALWLSLAAVAFAVLFTLTFRVVGSLRPIADLVGIAAVCAIWGGDQLLPHAHHDKLAGIESEAIGMIVTVLILFCMGRGSERAERRNRLVQENADRRARLREPPSGRLSPPARSGDG